MKHRTAFPALVLVSIICSSTLLRADHDSDQERCAALHRTLLALTADGKYPEAAQIGEELAELARKAFGREHPNYATIVDDLGKLHLSARKYPEAEALFEEAEEIRRRVLGEDHPAYIASLNNLGSLYRSMEDYGKAGRVHRKALEICRRAVGENHRDYASATHELGMLYMSEGELGEAEPLLKQAMQIYRKTRSEDDPCYARSLNSLGWLYLRRGQSAQAESLLKEALRINWRAYGRDHPYSITSVQNLAVAYTYMCEYTKGESLFRQVLEAAPKTHRQNDPQYATTLRNLGSLYFRMGKYSQAEPRYLEASAIFKDTLGENSANYAATMNTLGTLYAARGDAKLAQRSFHTGLTSLHAHVVRVLGGFSQNRQLRYLERVWWNCEKYLSFVRLHSDADDAVFRGAEWLARWKSLAAEVDTERYRMLRLTKAPKLRDLLQELIAARKELAEITLTPHAKTEPEEHRRRWQAAVNKVADLEARLAEESSEFAELRRIGRVELAEVVDALPEGSVLLDYAYFRDFNFKATGREEVWGDDRYVVFVTPAADVPEPVMVDLGWAGPIDDAIGQVRKAIAEVEGGRKPDDDKAIREKLLELRRLLIDPALPHIADRQHWIICPAGQVSLIPFECLPITHDRYLVERKKVSYLVAGRQAVAYAGPKQSVENTNRPLLVGDPDFNLSPEDQRKELEQISIEPTTVIARGVAGSRELLATAFARLPSTGREVEMAAETLGGFVLLRRQALEGAVKRVSRPQLLYLATHGFFLPSKEQDVHGDLLFNMEFEPALTGHEDGFEGTYLAARGTQTEHPLLRCGLALAGANRRNGVLAGSEIDDGILTGIEVAGVDLRGTQLVVLSACQTGLGDVKQGEGVMSLRRAFLLAGARRVLATFWMVPDRHTQQLMGDFVAKFQDGGTAVDALRGAQIAMITRLRKAHNEAHPFYWAAFTLTGDWR